MVPTMTQTLSFASPAASACLKESPHQRLPFRPASPPLHGGKIRRPVTFTHSPTMEELCPKTSIDPASEMLTHRPTNPAHSATFRNFSVKIPRNCRFCAKMLSVFPNGISTRDWVQDFALQLSDGKNVTNEAPPTMESSHLFHQKPPPFHLIPHTKVDWNAGIPAEPKPGFATRPGDRRLVIRDPFGPRIRPRNQWNLNRSIPLIPPKSPAIPHNST